MSIKPIIIDVDFKKSTIIKEHKIRHGDNVPLMLRVFDDGEAFDLSTMQTISLVITRLDRQTIVLLGKVHENQATFNLGGKELAVSGSVQATAQFYSVDGRVSTFNFKIIAESDPITNYIPLKEEETLIVQVLKNGPTIIEAAQTATVGALQAEEIALSAAEETNRSRENLTASVNGALDTLEEDKASALLEMAEERTLTNQVKEDTLAVKEEVMVLAKTVGENGDYAKEQAERAKVEADRLEGTDVSVLDNKITSINNNLTTQLADKASKSEVRLKSVKNELEDMSPTVLAAIQGGGTTSFNLLSIPQDGSVSAKKTDFFTFSRNLYNPNDINFLKGKAVSGFTETVVDNATANITGFIQISTGEKLFISKNGVEVGNANGYKILFYKSDGSFKSGQYYTLGGLTMPADVGRIRIQTDATAASLQIEKGSAVTSYEPYYEPKIKESAIPNISLSKVGNFIISPDDTTFINVGKNLFNPSDADVVLGGYYNATNVLTTAPTHNQTGFIPVVANQKYTASYRSAFVNWYNKDKDFMGSTESGVFAGIGYVTAPTGAYYARFIAIIAEWGKFQVELGQNPTTFEPYSKKLDNKYLPDTIKNPLLGKKFTSFGDSLTAQAMWQPHVVNYFNLVHTNLGIGSTTVAYVANREATYPCFTNATRIQAIKNSNPDIITILGGTNDAHLLTPVGTSAEYTKPLESKDLTTFKGGLSYLIQTLLAWKPTLEIIIATPMQSIYMTNPYPTYVNAIKEVAEYYALPFVNLYAESGISYFNIKTYTSDDLHPNAAGGKRIANMVIDKFKMVASV